MLFKTIKQFKAAYGGVQRTMNWETWVAFVNEAEQFFIIPAVGDELVTELSALIEDGKDDDIAVAATAKQKILIGKMRMAIAAYTDYVGWFRLIMTTGDAGKTVASPANMQAPGKWASVGGRRDAIDRGDKALEATLHYLEKNAADFATWKGSDTYTVDHKLLVSGATELTDFFPHANSSRRLYMGLKARINQAQNGALLKLIGKEFAVSLADKKKADDGSDEEKEAIRLAGKYVALSAVVAAIPYMNISEDWRLISEADGISNEMILPTARRNELLLTEGASLELAQNELLRYLNETATAEVLPLFFGSDYYVDPDDAVTASVYANKKENKFAVI